MRNTICIVFTALAALAAGCVSDVEDTQPSSDVAEAGQKVEVAASVESGFDLLCTLSCSFWNVCRFKNLSRPEVCGEEPPGCICTSFRGDD